MDHKCEIWLHWHVVEGEEFGGQESQNLLTKIQQNVNCSQNSFYNYNYTTSTCNLILELNFGLLKCDK